MTIIKYIQACVVLSIFLLALWYSDRISSSAKYNGIIEYGFEEHGIFYLCDGSGYSHISWEDYGSVNNLYSSLAVVPFQPIYTEVMASFGAENKLGGGKRSVIHINSITSMTPKIPKTCLYKSTAPPPALKTVKELKKQL